MSGGMSGDSEEKIIRIVLDYDRLGNAFAKALGDAGFTSVDSDKVQLLEDKVGTLSRSNDDLSKELRIAKINLRNVRDHLKCPDETNISDHAYTVSRKLIDYENEIKELKAEIVEFRFKNKNDS